MDSYWESRHILGIATMFGLFLTLGIFGGRTLALAGMLFFVFLFNVYFYVFEGFIHEFWMFALIVLGLYFIIRFWKGDFRHLFRKDTLTSDDE